APWRCRRPRRGPTTAPRTARPGRRRPVWCPTSCRGAAASGRARKSWQADRRRRRLPCCAFLNPVDEPKSYTGFRYKPITIKRAILPACPDPFAVQLVMAEVDPPIHLDSRRMRDEPACGEAGLVLPGKLSRCPAGHLAEGCRKRRHAGVAELG